MSEPFSSASFRADLHMHSNVSDGTQTPSELVQLVQKSGLNALALTDHDTVQGVEEAAHEAKASGLHFLSGIELSSTYEGNSVHILGYGIDPSSDSLNLFLKQQIEARNQRNMRIVEKLKAHNLAIDEKILESRQGVIGRVHIARELMRIGAASDIKEAFQKWIGDRAACFEPGVKPSPAACIIKIHEAGGKAFIAHPHLMERRVVLKLLKAFAWDGLEVYYARYTRAQQEEWLALAKRYRLLASGGSDFHGSVKKEAFLGSSWVDEPTWKAIVQDTFWGKNRL